MTLAGARPYLVSLPPGWVSIDVRPGSAATWRAQLLAAAARDPEVAAHRAELDRALSSITADAQRNNVSFCAAWFTVVDDVLPLQASLAVSVVELAGSGTASAGAGNRLQAIVAELDGEGRALAVVPLAGAEAVRSALVRRDAHGAAQLVVQHYIPHPAADGVVAILTFASPTGALFDELGGLFDDIADSFRFAS